MKRDMDLVRRIMLAVEAELHPGKDPLQGPFTMEGAETTVIAEHVRLLLERGYLEGEIDPAMRRADEAPWFLVERITWAGHDYLDDVRSDTVWNSLKETAKEKGLPLTFDIIAALAKAKGRALLGLPPQ